MEKEGAANPWIRDSERVTMWLEAFPGFRFSKSNNKHLADIFRALSAINVKDGAVSTYNHVSRNLASDVTHVNLTVLFPCLS